MLFRTRVTFFLRAFLGNPIVLMCFSFVVLFGFFIGISTPNFGALVRFKIPLVPLFVSGLLYIGELHRSKSIHGGAPFDCRSIATANQSRSNKAFHRAAGGIEGWIQTARWAIARFRAPPIAWWFSASMRSDPLVAP